MNSPVFCGIKHCGKSTLGKLTARIFGLDFADTDEELEKAYLLQTGEKSDCRTIFREHGEEYFRQLEADTIRKLSCGKVQVIALGGGVASNPFLTADELKKLGFWIFIDVPPGVAYKRILRHGLPPFLQNSGDPEEAFLKLYNERTPRFRELADMIYGIREERSPEEEAEDLTEKIRKEMDI